ncbi:hypothetical protein FOZ62_014853, partial [Perkinsus olseni]
EPYWSSDGIDLISDLTWLVVFAFSASVSVQISRLIREKEMRLREIMRMMGLMDVSYYLSWLITQILTWLIICLAISLVMKVGTYKHSSWFLIFMLNISFGLSSMSFAFLMSAIFTRERVGAVIGFFVYLAGLFISVPDYATASTKNFMSLIPIVGFREGLGVVGYLEETYGGLTSDTTSVDYRNYSYAQAVAMNFVASILWWILYYYVDQTNPFQVGFRRPYYFPFQKSYWLECFRDERNADFLDDEKEDSDGGEGNAVPREAVDASKEALRKAGKCVEISKLCKNFKGPSGETVAAVKGVSMSMYEGEIFALLGHNGAGKTTTMGAITGFLAPSSGKVSVYGLRVPKDMAAIRRITGVCPQHNALWPELTAFEHLECFGGIRGLNRSSKTFRESCDHLLLEVGLGGRKEFRSDSLSGGMQRKLSVAIAFVGDPKLVILDEPTSGMDPYARRTTWDLLKARRPGRIICLTTHYMDEADVLGDRIAIMGRGELKCLGSSSFLKKCYGCGYVLSFVKKQDVDRGDSTVLEFLKDRITDKSLIGQVKVLSSAGQELLVQVPFAAAKDFPALMDDLDAEIANKSDTLKGLLVAYGVSVTNLEEVFLRVADPGAEERSEGATARSGAVVPLDSVDNDSANQADDQDARIPETVVHIGEEDEPIIEPATTREQTMALIQRRIRFGLRDRKMFICQLLLPLILLAGALALVKQGASERVAPPLAISIADLNEPLQKAGSPRPWHIIHAGGDSDVGPFWSPLCDDADDYCDTLRTVATPPNQSSDLLAMQSHLRESRDDYEASSYIAFSHLNNATELQREAEDPPSRVVLWHNLTATASSAIALNAYVNAWFAAHGTDVKVTVVNHPMPQTLFEQNISVVVSGILSTIAVIWAFAFIPAGICSYIVMEKEKDVKAQLAISGCSMTAYWLAHFIFDTVFNLLTVAVAIAVFYAFDMEAFTESDKIGPTIMLLLLFAPSASTYAYLISFLYKTQFSAQTVTIVLNIAVGTIVVIVVSVLQTIPEEFCEDCLVAGNILMWIFRFVPSFALGFGFYRMAIYVSFLGVDPWGSEIFGTCTEKVLGTREQCYGGVADDLVYLAFASVAFLALCIWFDYLGTAGHWLSYKVKLERQCSIPEDQLAPEDADVTVEKERVAELDKRKQILAVDNVRKCYLPRGSL